MAPLLQTTVNDNETQEERAIDVANAASDIERNIGEDREDEEAIVWEENEVEDEDDRIELSLVGKIWTNRNVNMKAFITTMENVWQPKYGVEISNIGKNLYMCQFHHWKDKQYVLNEQPWHFDRHAIILKEIEENVKPIDIELSELPMWVRVYNLPFKGRLNQGNIEKIGNKLGSFIRMDNSGAMGIDKSIRIRIWIDVRKPLLKKVKLKMRNGVEEYFEVKYEKPPLFCFYCGKMGHGVKDCDDCRDVEEPENNYGPWMKASPWKKKVGQQQEKEGSKEKGCAKTLFFTKPKAKAGNQTSPNQLAEMVNKLEDCGINDRRSSLSSQTQVWNEKRKVDIQNNTEEVAEVRRKDDADHSSVSMAKAGPTTLEHQEKRTWQRINREAPENQNEGSTLSGSKRSNKEMDACAPMEIDAKGGTKKQTIDKKKKRRMYKFEEMWLRDETCADTIESAWEINGDICSKVAHTSNQLSAWSRNKFGDFMKEMKAFVLFWRPY
ncbi:hypothetical protein RDABS01_024322 [Bienertia sinuspersici]